MAGKQGKTEYGQEMLIGKMRIIPTKEPIPGLDIHVAIRHQTGIFVDFRIVLCQGRPDRRVHDGTVLNQLAVLEAVVRYAIGPVKLLIEFVVTPFKADKLKNEQTGRQASPQAENIDGGKYFAFKNIPESNRQVIA